MNPVSVDRAPFLGLQFDRLSTCEALPALERLHGGGGFSYVVTPNVDHVVQLHRRPPGDDLWTSYRLADLCLCDSRILQLLARWSRCRLPLAPGSDLTALLLGTRPSWAKRAIVIGGDSAMISALQFQQPQISWLHHEPPMGVRTNAAAQAAIVEFVESSAADVVFFAIGAPQSELLCRRIAERKRARGIALCIGASLEFVTGRKRRAPQWMQALKLEWLFRLSEEPRRLARRYLVDGPAIFRIWFRWLLTRRRPSAESDSSSTGGQ